jgi:hypothetical protein
MAIGGSLGIKEVGSPVVMVISLARFKASEADLKRAELITVRIFN